jgi:periplasmic divalent cation tolerance protein
MSEYIQMTTTTDSKELAQQIANVLVEQKLAACVQVSGPITSIYEWKSNIQTTEEWVCVIRTRRSLFPGIEKCIKSLHHYEVPEITVLSMEGSRDYLDWIGEVTG